MFNYVIWLVLLAPFPQEATPLSARDCYIQASELVVSDQPTLALQPLLTIAEQHSESEFAIPAVVRIAELYLVSGNAMDAAHLLKEWTSKGQPNTDGDQQFADTLRSLDQRMDQLLATALFRLSEEELNSFFDEVSQRSNGTLTKIESKTIRELARRAIQGGRYGRAIELLDQIGPAVTSQEKDLRDFHLPMAILRQSPEPDEIEQIRQRIGRSNEMSSADTLDIARYTGLNLAVAEAYRQLNDTGNALAELDALAVYLSEMEEDSGDSELFNGLGDTIESSTELGNRRITHREVDNWRASVDLRRAELMLLNGHYSQATEILTQAIEIYPNFEFIHEHHFLLSRCYVAAIEFDRAASELHQVLEVSPAGAERQSRSLWLLGELELLQRNFLAAIDFYDQVISLASQPQWLARSLLQKGKCLELLGRPLEAIPIYQRVESDFADSDVHEQATRRLTVIQQSLAMQARRSIFNQEK